MPIVIEDLLKPISAEQPAGADLRYAAITTQIKEARRQEDNVSQGVWKRQVKVADYAEVFKLSRQVLTKQSKDLQVAAWLTEALLAREGLPGLRQGLELVRRLLEDYWDTVHPQIDDGDLEMRSTPLRWIGFQLDASLRSVPLTAAGYDWFRYKESRGIPTEDETRGHPEKLQLRQELLAEGRIAPEEFDRAFLETPLTYYADLYKQFEPLAAYVRDLASFCDEKFAEDAPDFSPLLRALEEVGQTVRILLINKGGNPDANVVAEQVEEEIAPPPSVSPAEPARNATDAHQPSAPAPQSRPQVAPAPAPQSGNIVPKDSADAIDRIIAATHYLRQNNPGHPVPFLILRALRWGELRAFESPNQGLAEAPNPETRIDLKRLAAENTWAELIEKAETAQGTPSGRAWFDLQRYVVRACRGAGYDNAARAITSELRALLQDYPQLVEWTLTDDTPVANQETSEWMRDEQLLPQTGEPKLQPAAAPPPAVVEWQPRASSITADDPNAPPDAYDLALEAAQQGRIADALSILSEEMRASRSGRQRFLRKTQMVRICLATRNEAIALPILRDLVAEVERRNLEDWEEADLIAPPFQLLCRYLNNADAPREEKDSVYARLCRMDPPSALGVANGNG